MVHMYILLFKIRTLLSFVISQEGKKTSGPDDISSSVVRSSIDWSDGAHL